MTPEQYQKAKEVFIDLLNASPAEKSSRLSNLAEDEPAVADEVQSLLARHQSQTIIHSDDTTKSTGTSSSRVFKLRRFQSRLVGGGWPLLAALLSSIALWMFAGWLENRLRDVMNHQCERVLVSIVGHKSDLLHEWARASEIRFSDWGRSVDIRKQIEILAAASANAPNAEERNRALIESEAQRRIGELIARMAGVSEQSYSEARELPSSVLRYAVFNTNFELLADWQYASKPEILGINSTPDGAFTLTRVVSGKTAVTVLPDLTTATLSKDYPLEKEEPYILVLVPVFDSIDPSKVSAVLMIRTSEHLDEVERILTGNATYLSNCYLVNAMGVITTEAADLQKIAASSLYRDSQPVRGQPIVYTVDPEEPVVEGFQFKKTLSQLARTVPSRSLALMENGCNPEGYRDYRGKQVVGAWKWLEAFRVGLILEVEYDAAYQNRRLVHTFLWWFQFLPLLSFVILVGFSLRNFLPNSRLHYGAAGAYVLGEKIGEGGAGVVYRAKHSILDREGAVKIMKMRHLNHETLNRFMREVRIAAKLTHPNIVSIYDVGLSRRGNFYCAMELIDGVPLSDFIKFVPDLSIDRCVWILRQMASALKEAHDQGLVHRDIKPQNVMICRQGNLVDVVKVVDFGLAKEVADNTTRNNPMTRVLVGSPGFIAPERIEAPWAADPRVDVFSFGVCATFVLFNYVPTIGTKLDLLWARVRTSRFVSIQHGVAFQMLFELVSQCMAADPTDRPNSMTLVYEQLKQIEKEFPRDMEAAELWWNLYGEEMLRGRVTHGKSKLVPGS